MYEELIYHRGCPRYRGTTMTAVPITANTAVSIIKSNPITAVVLVVALVECWTRDREVTGSTRGRGAIKSTRSTQPSIPPG